MRFLRRAGPLGAARRGAGAERRMSDPSGSDFPDSGPQSFDLAVLSDAGTERPDNQDACGFFIEGPQAAVLVVADGIGGYAGGETASRMAVDVTLDAYRASPREWGAAPGWPRAPNGWPAASRRTQTGP